MPAPRPQRGPPALHQLPEQAKQDVGVQAALMRLVQNQHRVLAELGVVQALAQQRAICMERGTMHGMGHETPG